MEKLRIQVSNAEDRKTMAVILVNNGYTVRFSKEKKPESKNVVVYVEYWRGAE